MNQSNYLKVTLKLTQQKSMRIFGNNINPLKGLSIYNILTLARLEAYMPVCFFSTMVGLYIADSQHRLTSLLVIGLANTFAMMATCAFNDAEDAPEDILARSTKNVIALGSVSKSTGYLVAVGAAITSLVLSIIAGVTVFLIILVFLVTAFLYSWRPFRMKAIPFWDLSTHAIMGGLMFISSAWSSDIILNNHVLSICLISSMGTILALLTHQLSDYENDLAVNIRTTVVVLGKMKTYLILGGTYLLVLCLLTYECLSGFFPLKLILSFFVVTVCLILLLIALHPKQSIFASKRRIPWAVNAGAVAAIIMWYIS